ncbi:MAG: hypothetical protein ACYDA8_00120, partial [Deferrisomatales bacterium]
QFAPRIGNTASAEPCRDDEILSLTNKIFSAIDFVGPGSVEFKRDTGSGKYFCIEPTVGRTDLQSEIAVVNGCNIPAFHYYDLIGDQVSMERVRAAAEVSCGRRVWMRGWADVMSAAYYWQAGELSLWSWARSYCRRLSFAVWRLSDPKPFSWLVRRSAEAKVKGFVRALVGERGVASIRVTLSRLRRAQRAGDGRGGSDA